MRSAGGVATTFCIAMSAASTIIPSRLSLSLAGEVARVENQMVTTAAYFPRDLIEAIDNWQAGSTGKLRKAKRLRRILGEMNLDGYFRSCDEYCYGRSVLDEKAVRTLLFEFHVPEETSSWSTSIPFVAGFKGGPPGLPHPGVIFRRMPKKDEVVLNLHRLFEHDEFEKSLKLWEAKGLNLSRGLRKYGSLQREVIMDVKQVPHAEIFAFGSDAAEMHAAGDVEGAVILGDASRAPHEVGSLFAQAACR